jgi:predicted metal-dependent hydrolase
MRPDAVENIIEFGARRIAYRLHRRERKHLKIVVSPGLSVNVYAPAKIAEERITAALHKKAAWIARAIDKLEAFHPLPEPKRYISGETILYLGRQYRLKLENGSRRPPKLLGKFLWVWVDGKSDTRMIKRTVDEWYSQRAQEILNRYLEICHQIASRHGIPFPHLAIRSMQRRWGSCSARGRITLNTKLVQAPLHCFEYVIMHELCHLKQRNHSKAFYSLLTRCMPDWRRRRELLTRFGGS